MEIPLYLAMTAAELHNVEVLPQHSAWMACHFSAYGTGLSNVPEVLPSGSMLMLNDRTPICGHDAQLVAMTLCKAADTLECECILLDFQRKGYEELPDVIRAVLDQAACPVGVSSLYAADFDCPVLVPPIPPHIPPEEALAPWKGRELWLELSTEGTEITVTEEGSRYTSLPHFVPKPQAHQEEALHCHYEITAEDAYVRFHLGRTGNDQEALLEAVQPIGVNRAVTLWQDMTK